MSNDKNNLVYREQLDDNVIEMLSEDIGSNYSLRTENTKTIVAALNEIHGKDVICNAVGSPLLTTDTFAQMGEKIKGLIADFKTKLLRLNISTSSVDKLESLINKLDGIELGDPEADDRINTIIESLRNILIENGITLSGDEDYASLLVKIAELVERLIEEKNMLIINNNGLDIISATELPGTGRENQICVLTDNPVDNILVSQFVEDDPLSEDVIFVLLCNYKNDKQVVLGNQNYVHTSLYFLSISQGSTKLRSYIYKNNQWVIFTDTTLFAMDNGVIMNIDIFGELKEVKSPGSYCTFSKVNDGYSLNFKNMPDGEFIFAYKNSISFANYSKMYVSFKDGTGAGTAGLDDQYVGIYFVIYNSSTKKTVYTKNITYWEQEYSSKVRTFEVDLTNVSHEGCLALKFDFVGSSRHLIITDWYLEQ